jgi:hypothetical protein
LDGKDLKTGDRLQIWWPTGDSEVHKIVVVNRDNTISDMGHPYTVPVRKAHVEIAYRGVKCLVPIEGLEASWV